METPLQKIKEFCQDQENEFSVLGYDASQYELGYTSAIREINDLCEEIPDTTTQLQADKAELLEILNETFLHITPLARFLKEPYQTGLKSRAKSIESLIQKHKQ